MPMENDLLVLAKKGCGVAEIRMEYIYYVEFYDEAHPEYAKLPGWMSPN